MRAHLTLAVALLAAINAAPAAAADVQWGASVNTPPPAQLVLVTPPPRPGYRWAPGYWGWSNDGHVWLDGTWLRERPGYAYWQPRWVMREGSWWLQRGQWARNDSQRDGVPNRWDPQRDSDGVPYR
jgi:hypothetical protein